MAFGTWQIRFIDWLRDLGFLQKPGVETKAKDTAEFVQPSGALSKPGNTGFARINCSIIKRNRTSASPRLG
jgi:hypothetical protein